VLKLGIDVEPAVLVEPRSVRRSFLFSCANELDGAVAYDDDDAAAAACMTPLNDD